MAGYEFDLELGHRRTYMSLKESLAYIDSLMDGIESHISFKTAFSFFFLIDCPEFDHRAHSSNSIQTFYANHYLRNVIEVDILPSSELIYSYINSKGFSRDLEKVILRLCKFKVDSDLLKSEARFDHLVKRITPPISFMYLVSIINKRINEDSGLNYISSLSSPSKDIYREIKEKGYAVEHDFLSKEVLSKLQMIVDEISLYEKNNGTAYLYGQEGNNQRIYNLLSKHPVFHDLLICPYLTTLCNNIFERPTFHEKYGLNSLTAHIVAPGASAIPWHLDSIFPEPIPAHMIRFICIISLDKFTSENGATAFVPESHNKLKVPTPEDIQSIGDGDIISCDAGSLIMFNGATWHHSSANKTNKKRRGLMLSFAASYFMEICGEEEHLSIIPKKSMESFSPKVKQMVGYQRAIKKGAKDISERITCL